MLSLRQVAVTYGPTTAVDRVDLTVPDGRVVALLGPSGCGKSTLLRAVAGLEPVAAGSIRWNGQDLAGVPVHKRGFGLMFQDGVLFPHRTVAGNVSYGLRRSGLSAAEIRARVDDLLDLVGLPGYGERSVPTLSGGEAQRVALARALAPRPRLLLLDEPLAALDRSLRDRLLTDLQVVLEITGTTALFVTHDQSEAFAIADGLAVMRAGRIVQTGSPRAVWSAPADEWVARFVGYSTVLTGPVAERVWAAAETDGIAPAAVETLALRPASLVVDPRGTLTGTVLSMSPRPEGVALSIDLTGCPLGPGGEPAGEQPGEAGDGTGSSGQRAHVRAVGPADLAVTQGDVVRLRFDPAHAAVLSSGDRVGSSGTIDP